MSFGLLNAPVWRRCLRYGADLLWTTLRTKMNLLYSLALAKHLKEFWLHVCVQT